jgi:hypothetical protein
MSVHDRPLSHLDEAIDRVLTPAERISDAKPVEQAIVRDSRGRMIHHKRRADGTMSERLVGHG